MMRFCTSCVTSDDFGSGIWQSGNGLVGGEGDTIYFETGNGDFFGANNSDSIFDHSFVKLQTANPAPGLKLFLAYQPPKKEIANLNYGDTDLGSGGPVLLPGGVLVGGGKQGRYYVVDADSMTLTQDTASTQADGLDGFQAFFNTYHMDPSRAPCQDYTTDNPPKCQDYSANVHANPGFGCCPSPPGCYVDQSRYQKGEICGPNIHAGPVYWSTANSSYGLLYQMAEKDYLKAFRYDKASHHVDESPFLTASPGTVPGNPKSYTYIGVRPPDGMPGGFSSLSANVDHDGILWTSIPLADAQGQIVPGRLMAFNASTLKVLWHHDGGYQFAKFVPPTIADGKVIRATWSQHGNQTGSVVVYGLRNPSWLTKNVFFSWLTRIVSSREPTPVPRPVSGGVAVDEKFGLSGGPLGLLKNPVGEPQSLHDAEGGWFQDFRGVVIGAAWSTASIHPDAKAPMPTCSRPGGAAGTALESSVYWTSKTGAHIVMGEIRQLWLKLGGQKGKLGYPISDEQPTPDGMGRMSEFERGQIWWYFDRGAFIHDRGAVD
jgi:hypothetical protein